jgi:peptide/nickel transport system permease protein
MRVGMALVVVTLAVALLGPWFAPHDPYAVVGVPLTSSGVFGTDVLGRDVLSRVLAGGRNLVAIAGIATVLAYIVGGTIGLAAGHSRSSLDPILMRLMDILLAFPPILFLLVIATGAGPSTVALVLGIATIHTPGIARVMRSATLDKSGHGYVEAAAARGERTPYILFLEILPNITGTVAADAGPRFTLSILLIAAVNYLGLGLRPPTADWALMVSENRIGITIQPLAVFVPAALIVMLTIGVNVVADEWVRSRGSVTGVQPAPR